VIAPNCRGLRYGTTYVRYCCTSRVGRWRALTLQRKRRADYGVRATIYGVIMVRGAAAAAAVQKKRDELEKHCQVVGVVSSTSFTLIMHLVMFASVHAWACSRLLIEYE